MKRSLLALSLLAALPFAATAAEGVSYNHVQGGYVATNGNGNADADGFGIDGSVAVHPNFHLFGGYNQQEIDNTNIDVDQWKLGVGYNYEISPKADLVTRIAYEKYDAGSGFDFDGYSAEVGVRGALGTKVEGYAMAGYEDFEQLTATTTAARRAGEIQSELGSERRRQVRRWRHQWTVGPRFTW